MFKTQREVHSNRSVHTHDGHFYLKPGKTGIRVPKGGFLEPWSPEISVVEPGVRSFY